jgi:hypothetical protein
VVRDRPEYIFTAVLTTHQFAVHVESVDNSPHARIVGFGRASIAKKPDRMGPEPATRRRPPRKGSVAPEVLIGQDPTEKSDVYSFAFIMAEVGHE